MYFLTIKITNEEKGSGLQVEASVWYRPILINFQFLTQHSKMLPFQNSLFTGGRTSIEVRSYVLFWVEFSRKSSEKRYANSPEKFRKKFHIGRVQSTGVAGEAPYPPPKKKVFLEK